MLEEIRARVERARAERVFPGCVVGVITPTGGPEYICVGAHTYDVNARSVMSNTLYDVASVTKSIPTASLALVLACEKALSLDDRVADILPELQNHHNARVRDLLTYSVKGPRLSDLKYLTAQEMLGSVMSMGFAGPPGESSYANVPALLLGLVIERVANVNLGILSDRYFFSPLCMSDTAFYAGVPMSRAVPTEVEDWRGAVAGVAHDEGAYVLGRAGRIGGHAGLFSTAPDLLAFLRAVLDAKDARFGAIAEGAESGLGWQVAEPYFMSGLASSHTFGKTGFTGASVLADRQRGVALVILSNRTYPKRPLDQDAINSVRSDIAEIVLSI